MGIVIDVFRGTGKVDEFTDRRQLAIVGDLFFEEVFDGFYIMIGCPLNRLDSPRIFFVEIGDYVI